MEVEITNLSKKFGDVVGVEMLDLDIKDGEFVAFLGPSGCGKTTTLLMLAGIYKPSTGTIRFGDRIVNQLQPKDRNIGMVFQSYALYPHMTVFENIAYPLKLKKVPRQEQQRHVEEAADTMGIGHLLDRRPGQLSGGQQQRVALGRALVKEPDILLFDEPLSNLDARLRLTMRGEIRSLQRRLGITSIYVTHDQVEALTMADRIAVMNHGQLQAFATPDDLYERPDTKFIASFVGNPPMNLLDVELVQDNGDLQLRSEALQLTLPPEYSESAAPHLGALTFGIRPEDITLADQAGISGEILVVEPLGRDDLLDVIVGVQHFFVLADPKLKSRAGDGVHLSLDMTRAHFFDPQNERALRWR